jgi:hypothetical protein
MSENKEYTVISDQDSQTYIFQCPNCDDWVQVAFGEVNCGIFRHAFLFTKTSQGGVIPTEMINPHTSEKICKELIRKGEICGCGKPFQMLKNSHNNYIVKICDYI